MYVLIAVIRLGLASIRQFDIINRLKAAMEDKASAARQGGLLAFEQLCTKLGKYRSNGCMVLI